MTQHLSASPGYSGTPLAPDALERISSLTLASYAQRADAFREATQDHDVSQNVEAFLRHVAVPPPHDVLDFGCGPGRDLATFTRLGHRAIGLEGAEPFAAMARASTGCDVWEQDFLKLDLPAARFDGVFANASLFHVPRQELSRVLREIRATLRSGGILFSSNPHGHNDEGWSRGRYGAWHDLAAWQRFLDDAGFDLLTHYYRPPGLPREQQPWLATIARRRDP